MKEDDQVHAVFTTRWYVATRVPASALGGSSKCDVWSELSTKAWICYVGQELEAIPLSLEMKRIEVDGEVELVTPAVYDLIDGLKTPSEESA